MLFINDMNRKRFIYNVIDNNMKIVANKSIITSKLMTLFFISFSSSSQVSILKHDYRLRVVMKHE